MKRRSDEGQTIQRQRVVLTSLCLHVQVRPEAKRQLVRCVELVVSEAEQQPEPQERA